jgi:hypothetical protein
MKMRRPHRGAAVPRKQSFILEGLKTLTGHCRWLFPSVRTLYSAISENTLNAALRRLGYGPEMMTAHRLPGDGHQPALMKWAGGLQTSLTRQLAHQEQNAIRRAYTHGTEYWSQRVDIDAGMVGLP